MDIINAEDHILRISNEIDNLKDEELILQALNINSEEYLSAIISFRDVGTKTLCANRINELELSYQCFDCSKDTSHIICKECFIPEIHKNHAIQIVQMSSQSQGYCDCGDTFMLDRNSMCPKHLQKDVKVENTFLENNPVFKKYEKFLMDSFGLLYKKLEKFIDYPDDLWANLENIIQNLNNEILDIYFNSNIIYFVSIKDSINEAKQIHALIFRTLQIITNDNIIWGYLTGKILKQEFQTFINQQPRSTSLLEQYLQFNARLEGCLKFKQDISAFFPLFFQDDDFRTCLSTCVIQNFKNFYALVCQYELITINNTELTFQIYKGTKDQKLAVLIEKILACSQIEEIKSKNSLIQGPIINKLFLFMQRCYIEMLRLYKTVQSPVYYQLFDIVSDLILQIPLIDLESLKVCNSYSYGIELMGKCKKAINGQINQIKEILSEDFSSFKLQLLNPNSKAFQKLLNESLLIYSLTRRYPCQQMKNFALNFPSEIPQKNLCINYSLITSQKMLSSFRCDLNSILLTLDNLYSFDVQNILRIMLHYFLNNLASTFDLKYKSPIQLIAFNQVLSDRNFITVLSIYLHVFPNSQDAYNNVLELSGLDKSQFNQIMHQILKRILLNYIIFSSSESFDYYKGKEVYWKKLENEVSLQQVDAAYIQLYAFLFQDLGINHIVQDFIGIKKHLKQNIDLSFLICKIAQTDYDLIQCVGSITGNQFNGQFQKGLAKLFQTIFYSQTFYNLNEMRTLLKEFSYENKIDLETLILSSCEINQDNGQLQLKKELKLQIYEPIYASNNEMIKEKINDQLQMQNDKFVELFGSSLEYELKYYGTPKSTLTNIRYEILKAISQDQNQYLLEIILKDLENNLQSNTGFIKQLETSIKVLQKNAIYINLLYLSNQMFCSNNAKIQHLIDKIQHYSQIFILLDNVNHTQKLFFQVYCSRFQNKSFSQNLSQKEQQITESKSKQNHQNKEQFKKKFNLMKENFNNKITNEDFSNDTDEICLLCKLAFENNDLQYQPILIQYSNILEQLKIIEVSSTTQIDFLSVHVSNCSHIFHSNCLKKYMFDQKFKDEYYQCPLCYSPYNFIIPNPYQIQNIEIAQFELSLQAFIESLSAHNQEILAKHYMDTEFNLYSFLDEILSQILCNLIFQLLSDIKTFIEKNQHLFIQKVITLMRLLYQNLNKSLIDIIQTSKHETLFKVVNIVQLYLIKQTNLNQFKQNLTILFNPQISIAQALFELFTERKVIFASNNIALPYDILKIKDSFKKEMINFLSINFSQFFAKHFLTKCQKKKCQLLNTKLEIIFSGQCICLICFKKMCLGSCGKFTKKRLGNLQRHCIKKHQSKSIFLNVEDSSLILMRSPSYILMPNTLYTNRIGDQPIKGPYPLQNYSNFQINQKILDQIFDIILDEKYLQKLHANSQSLLTKFI